MGRRLIIKLNQTPICIILCGSDFTMHLTTEQERTLIRCGDTVSMFKHKVWRVFKGVQIALVFAVNAL